MISVAKENKIIIEAARLIDQSKLAVFFTGAGISTPPGIPDFRGTHGMWRQDDPMEVASLSAFRNHPDRFFSWFHNLARAAYHASPNPAHLAVGELERLGKIRGVITQNIDGLHTRADSVNVFELHGSIRTAHCLSNNHRVVAEDYLPGFIASGKIPLCPQCQSMLKPDIVLYEEMLPQDIWKSADILSEECDLMVVVGSSLEVFPASSIPYRSVENAAKLLIINLSTTRLDSRAQFIIRDDVNRILPKILECINEIKSYPA
jgi:NAD-dependent deacetylase